MIAVVAAPTNLGLRPPVSGGVPGASKAPEALRQAGLNRRLIESGAREAGTVLPGRYVAEPDLPPGRLRNQEAIVEHAVRLAATIEEVQDHGLAPLVIGGDCSVLIATGLAMARRGRHGLVHVDGHTDFRHPGNSDSCASLTGEDLAAAVGLHWPSVADIEHRGPYFAPEDVVHAGCRDDDHLPEVRRILAGVMTTSELQDAGASVAADRIRDVVTRPGMRGFWLHVDVDVLDPVHLLAVDSPSPGGLSPAAGAQVTVFDPDLDPSGTYARLVTDVVVDGLGGLGSALP